MKPQEYAKAIVAALIAGASFAIPVVDDGLTTSEGLGIAVAALTALATVWAVPNARTRRRLKASDVPHEPIR